MPIGFNEVQASSLTPFFYVEINNSGAVQGSNQIPWQALLIGQQLSSKSAPSVPTQITDLAQARSLFGAGSQLANMVEAFLASNPTTPLYVLPLADAAGVAATGTLAFTGPATAAGVVALMIGGRYLQVPVSSTDTATVIATNVAAAINAAVDMSVTATSTTGTVTVTAKNKGLAGNETNVRINHYQGEVLPAGVACTITAMAGGTINPDLSTANVVGLIANRWFQVIAMPYTDPTAIALIETELANRWKANSQTGGIVYTAKNVTFSSLTTYGATRNSPFSVVMNAEDVPTTPWEVAAETAALVAKRASIDPARPVQRLAFSHSKAPTRAQENSFVENETLLGAGIATFTVDASRTMRLQRVVTTYKTGPTGSPDPSYRNIEAIYTLQAIRYDWTTFMLNKYPDAKLADDGTNFGAGQSVITPKVGRSEAIGRFREWELLGWVEGFDAFKEALIVTRSSSDRDRLDFLLRPNLMNQFRIGATQIQFIL